MPELPEVETSRRGLAPLVEGRRILAIEVRQPELRWPIPEQIIQLSGATVVALERPRLGPRKEAIRANLARLLNVQIDCVNVKGKTGEGVDAVGEGRAIDAHAVVLLTRRAAPDNGRDSS